MKFEKKKVFISLLGVLSIFFIFIAYKNTTIFAKGSSEFKVCIDPGHQKKGINTLEPNAPGSNVKKPKVSSGTRGASTKKWEYEVNLDCSLLLKNLLLEEGYQVILTRESNDVSISNVERATVANNNQCDMSIKIHCDSVGNSSKTGASILVPAKNSKYTSSIYEESYKYAEILSKSLKSNGVKVNGIFERNDLTGFNWSKVPVITLEMGFMSNHGEDNMLCNKAYEEKLMMSVKDALNIYKEEL